MKTPLVLLSICLLFFCDPFNSFEIRADEDGEHEVERQDFLFLVNEAYLEEEGEWQFVIQSGFLNGLESEEHGETVEEDLFFVDVEFEYGITDSITLELALPYERIELSEPGEGSESFSGIGDGEIGLAFALIQESEDSPALTLALEGSFPSGDEDEGLGRGVWGWEASLISSKRLAYNLYVHSHLGFEFANNVIEEGELSDEREYSYGLALAQQVTEDAFILLELSGEYEEEKSLGETESGHALYLGPGAFIELESGWEVGANLVIGLTDDSYDWGGRMQASIEF